jgi:hypothetical protein
MSRLAGVLVLLLLAPGLAPAPPADSSGSLGAACSTPAHRAFDFWVGHWVVSDSAGARVGTSRVTRQARGCGLLEQWTGESGYRGVSLNYYDPDTGTWHQDWVGSDGLLLHLSGGVQGRAMVLTGTRLSATGPVLDRIRWRPLSDGGVRQEWTSSPDGGTTWKPVFLGFYAPANDDS